MSKKTKPPKEVPIYCAILNGNARLVYCPQGTNFVCPSKSSDSGGFYVCDKVSKECPLFSYAGVIAIALQKRQARKSRLETEASAQPPK